MGAQGEAGTKNIAIDKKLIADVFFRLSTGLVGEILKNYVNYSGRIAIYGNLRTPGKLLKDFIYESNKRKTAFFVETEEEAVTR